jgi:hypothetical protein
MPDRADARPPARRDIEHKETAPPLLVITGE